MRSAAGQVVPIWRQANSAHLKWTLARADAPAVDYVPRLLDTLGIMDGPTHTELIITPEGPRMVETHTRAGGDQIPQLLQAMTGIDMIELAIRQALGERVLAALDETLAHGTVGFIAITTLVTIGDRLAAPSFQAVTGTTVGDDQYSETMGYVRAVRNAGFSLGALLTSLILVVGTPAAYDALVIGNAVSFAVAGILLRARNVRAPRMERRGPRLLGVRRRYLAARGRPFDRGAVPSVGRHHLASAGRCLRRGRRRDAAPGRTAVAIGVRRACIQPRSRIAGGKVAPSGRPDISSPGPPAGRRPGRTECQ